MLLLCRFKLSTESPMDSGLLIWHLFRCKGRGGVEGGVRSDLFFIDSFVAFIAFKLERGEGFTCFPSVFASAPVENFLI